MFIEIWSMATFFCEFDTEFPTNEFIPFKIIEKKFTHSSVVVDDVDLWFHDSLCLYVQYDLF